MNLLDLYAKIAFDSSEYDKGIDSASKKASSFSEKLGSGLKAAAAVGTAALGAATGAVLAFGKSSIDTGMQFDSSMSQVAATMGTTVDQIQNLRDFALEMGSKTAFSASQAADALNYMALAGYDAEQSMEALPNVLNLAAAGGIELAQASDMVTDAQSALGLSMEESAQLVDKMAMASSKSNTSVAQLGDAILTIGGTAKNMAGGTTELATALGILADNGVKGAEGGTALRNIILSLSAPTDKAADSLKALGINVYDAEGKMRPLNETFEDLNAAMSSMTQGEQTEVLNNIFNKVDLKSVNALLANSGDRFNELSSAINNAQGAAENMANTQLDNLAGDITLFQSALEGAKIAVSDQLMPAFREFVQFGSTAVSSLSQSFQKDGLSGAMDTLTDVISDGVGMISKAIPEAVNAGAQLLSAIVKGIGQNLPALVSGGTQIITTLAQSISAGIPNLYASVPGMITGFAEMVGENAPLLLDAALSLVENLKQGITENLPAIMETGLNTLLDFSQGLREGAGQLVDAGLEMIMSIADGLIESLPVMIQTIPTIITNIAGIINDNAPKLLKTGAELLWKLVVGIVQNIPVIVANLPKIIEAIVAVFTAFNWMALGKNIITMLKNGITAMVGAIKGAAGNVSNSIINALKSLPSKLLEIGKGGIQGIINGIRGLLGSLGSAANSIGQAILNAVKSLPGKMLQIGGNIIQGLINGIKGKLSAAVGAIGNVASAIRDKITGFFSIHSPSRVMMQIGGFIVEGLSIGIANGEKAVMRTVAYANFRIRNAFEQSAELLNNKIAAIEETARKREAEKELKAYQRQKSELYEKLKTAELKDRVSIQEEIDKLDADWNEKRVKEAEQTEKEYLQSRITSIETLKSEYEKAYKEILDKQEKMSDKLASFGDLFTMVKEGSKEYMTIDNLQEDIDAINKYGDALEALKERGTPDDLMDEVLNMSVDEATKYSNKLIQMSDEAFENYIGLWNEKQSAAKSVAAKFFKNQLKTVVDNYSGQLGNELSGVETQANNSGVSIGQNLVDGMKAMEYAVEVEAARLSAKAQNAIALANSVTTTSSDSGVANRIVASSANFVLSGIKNTMSTVNVNLDGTQIARAVYQPLQAESARKGTSLA